MQENNFQNLEIFEAPVLNEYCDILVKNVREITGENLYLVGSVSKILNGDFTEEYRIKDIDFIVSMIGFQKLIRNKNILFPMAKMIEERPERLIIYLQNFAIEIWNYLERNTDKTKKLYKDKIPYLCQLEPNL
ncbi:hypothetical protein [Chryseobacterium mulctrae]|uniref:hypothetical protein n=1 Tax=Chryseobacterium mulctrae TaxID=2576777 RepID=UPI0011179E89|nr:hypothetical protein [Chryseobacterium mulctrae]